MNHVVVVKKLKPISAETGSSLRKIKSRGTVLNTKILDADGIELPVFMEKG